MSVLVETSAGEIVIDLYVNDCPNATKNFLKLCKIKYYNGCLFYNVQQNFLAQTGDPTGTGNGGDSIYKLIDGPHASSFSDEINKKKKYNKLGLVGMAHTGGKEDSNRSQFFLTLRPDDMEYIVTTHTIFGEVAEGLEVLEKINSLYCDEDYRPYQDLRIKHTYILDDPFPDPPALLVPPGSPEHSIPPEEKVKPRISFEESLEANPEGLSGEDLETAIKRKEAKSRAIVLEMTGDLPDAEVKPPEEVLFVCKLNPVTTDEDLELIFSRFGTIKSCEIIRDFKTGDSLNYAFIEFELKDACIEAYEKMNNVLIDDRRIKVDFSQSVSKLWNRFLLKPRAEPKVEKETKMEKDLEKYTNHGRSSILKGQEFKERPIKREERGSKGSGWRGDSSRRPEQRERKRSRSRDRGDRLHRHDSSGRKRGREEEGERGYRRSREERSGGGHNRRRDDSRDRRR